MNTPPSDDADSLRRLLSAMVDGEVDAAEAASGCIAWAAAEGSIRHSWHAYHLIGDVLRSENLANAPARDEAFLERLRVRLDAEPAVLPPPQAATRRRGWMGPMALAAGVMGLATVLVVAVAPTGSNAPASLVVTAPVAAVTSAAADTPVAAEVAPPGGIVVRNAQLDRYLRAHRDYADALPGSLPGGSGRSITTVSLQR